jgi:hypothetical protein
LLPSRQYFAVVDVFEVSIGTTDDEEDGDDDH